MQKPRSALMASLYALDALDELVLADHAPKRSALPRAGGKASSCARLRNAGFPVPDGFVVLATQDDIPQDDVDAAVRRLGNGPFAVRSSAVDEDSDHHSFAGIHYTRLNVAPSDVSEAMRACLASVLEPAATLYRTARGIRAADAVQAVLVQCMVPAAVAGVAFTVDVVHGRDEIIISAIRGSGHRVVEGSVDADEFRMHRPSRTIVKQHLGAQSRPASFTADGSTLPGPTAGEGKGPCLDAAQLQALCDLLLRIERHFGAPQDVEWCYDGERFWVLQSRPITARNRRLSLQAMALRETDGVEWSRTNVREVLPDLTCPQTLRCVVPMINGAMQRFFGPMLAPDNQLGPTMRAIGGRAYFNLTQFRRLARLSLLPPGLFLKAMGHADELRADDMEVRVPSAWRFFRVLPALGRITVGQSLLRWRGRRLFKETERFIERLNRTPLTGRSDEQLVAVMEDLGERVQDTLLLAFGGGSFLHWQWFIEWVCSRVGFSAERLINAQLALGEKTVSGQQAFDLLRVAQAGYADPAVRAYFAQRTCADRRFDGWQRALRGTRFKRELFAFLDRYGHRGVHETDWSMPRYTEDPAPLLFALSQLVQAPHPPSSQQVEARIRRQADDAWRDFCARVTGGWCETLLPTVACALRRLKEMYVVRERNRFEMVRVLQVMRNVAVEMSRRFVQRGWIDSHDDYFMLTVEEVMEVVRRSRAPGGLRAIVQARGAEQERFASLEMPLFLRDADVADVLRGVSAPVPSRNGGVRLRGMCTSPGRVEGTVVVLKDPADFEKMRPGAVLVAPATDPSWIPLFTLAAGMVVEIGGTLSHASTIAREYGLPALANVKDATRLLRDGDRVRLDATAGYVDRLN